MPRKDTCWKITIRNWDKYQREMRGGEKRKRRREWVAMSTGLLHDPQFFRLTIEQRYLWVMLVCYAGAVGPAFELRASDARVLFKLRSNADFQPLMDQGFIDLKAATNKTYKTNKTGHTQPKKRAAPAAKKKQELIVYPEGLNTEAWDGYVKNRRELKCKPLTPTGEQKQMKYLAGYAPEIQLAAAAESIRNGWQGIFPEKLKPNGGYKTDMDHNREAIQRWLDESTRDDEEAGVREPDGQSVCRLPGQTTG